MHYNILRTINIIFLLIVFSFGVSLIIKNMLLLKSYNQISLINELKNDGEIKKLINIDSIKKLEKNKDKKNVEENLLHFSEIVVTVKKNDTFSKILKSFIEDDGLQNKIIQKINKKFNLKTLNINQKIIFYKDKSNRINRIIIPIDFFAELIIELNDDNINVFL